MSAAGSYDPRLQSGGFDGELERLRTQAFLSWQSESRLLCAQGLKDGQSILELGSGPGFFTSNLLKLLPHAAVTAVDVNPELMDYARASVPVEDAGRLRFLNASALDTGLQADSHDFAIARLLFQHLEDPLAAAREALRTLRPGGQMAVVDVDGELWGIVQPVYRELGPIMAKAGRVQADWGGSRLIGRRLWRILSEAGFADVHLESFVYHSDELGIEPFLPQMEPARLRPALEAGLISAAEYALVEAGFRRFRESPDAYVLMVGLICFGTKR